MSAQEPRDSQELLGLLEAELYRRVTEGPCESCGRSAASVQELEVVRKYLNTQGVIRTPGYRSDEERGPKMTHGSPFPDPEHEDRAVEA